MTGPSLPISERTHASKYRSDGETFVESMYRIANGLSDTPEHYHALVDILTDMRFLPAGRVQAAIGAPRKVTAINCFVSGTIEDNFVDGLGNGEFFSKGGISARATEAAQTMRMGGGIGYDFSTLRPRGDLIVSLQARASGPVSFMGIFDAYCRSIASAGHRRGAQMGVLRCDHPDIEEFINAKQNDTALTGFNVSIGITDEFMECVVGDKDFDLKWNKKVYKTIRAKVLWEKIMRSTWDYAEPGVLFLDTINRMNNLWYCEQIAATNPCGEQPLPPYGACLLGSFNLAKYIKPGYKHKEFDLIYYRFDWNQLRKDIPLVVRAMDNVIEETAYPLKEQEREEKSKRRMGLGVAGLANAGEAIGYPYGSADFIRFTSRVLRTIAEGCYQASAILSKEKGYFPLFDRAKYLKGNFIKTLSPKTRALINKYGIRNSHLTSIAPTGTIALCADNISSGIEPVYSHSYKRTIMTFDGPQIETITDYGYREFGIKGKTAIQCSADDHLNALIAAYQHVDSAVSKTCNVNPKMAWEDFKDIYVKAWRGGCKGCTTFNPSGKRMGILDASPEEQASEGEACYIDSVTGRKTCE